MFPSVTFFFFAAFIACSQQLPVSPLPPDSLTHPISGDSKTTPQHIGKVPPPIIAVQKDNKDAKSSNENQENKQKVQNPSLYRRPESGPSVVLPSGATSRDSRPIERPKVGSSVSLSYPTPSSSSSVPLQAGQKATIKVTREASTDDALKAHGLESAPAATPHRPHILSASSSATKTSEHNSPAIKSSEHNSPAIKSSEHNSPTIKSSEHNSPSNKPSEHNSPVNKPSEHSSLFVKSLEHPVPSVKSAGRQEPVVAIKDNKAQETKNEPSSTPKSEHSSHNIKTRETAVEYILAEPFDDQTLLAFDTDSAINAKQRRINLYPAYLG